MQPTTQPQRRPNNNQVHRTTSGGGKSQNPKRGMGERRQSSRGGKSQQQQPPLSLENVEPLKPSENRWVRPTGDNDELTAASRYYRGQLNKLTVEKFDIITEEILKHDIKSADILRELINLIFDKATDEANFSSMYAELCHKVQAITPTFENNFNFKRALLNKCQEEFERNDDVRFFLSIIFLFWETKKNKLKFSLVHDSE